MILIEAGETSDRAFDAKLIFCAQMARRGHAAIIDDASLPEALDRNGRFEAAPYLRALAQGHVSRLIVIGAETIADEVLIRLRRIGLGADVPATLIGRFGDHQAKLSAQSKIAYVLGREPDLIDLTEVQPVALVAGAVAPGAAIASLRPGRSGAARVCLVLPDEMVEEPATLPLLLAMDNLPDITLSLILSGRARELVRTSRYAALRVCGLAEFSPPDLARQADIAVIFGTEVPGERIAAMAADLLASGGVVVDCTPGAVIAGASAPALRGPLDLAALSNYLRHTVLPNCTEIERKLGESPWIAAQGIERLEGLLGLPQPDRRRDAVGGGRTVFLPTNGNGLGHARRCTLIAKEMAGARPVAFAAFPSCVPLVQAAGYDCLPLVSKSPFHRAEHANDLVNYMRLRRALRQGDRLVFDGGYVFDSIYRTVIEKELEAVWVRRGLWQAAQISTTALDRESVFRRVVVPTEAFDELNGDLSFGDHVRKVGPIIGDRPVSGRAALRASLSEGLGRAFDTLVVTMLGGGVAADRTAQIQVLSALLERRANCLHLALIWPGSTVPPALYGWQNTVVCQTRNATDIAAAADLVVTAAGYNSFHEVLYHGIPAIFVPQMAAFMDDQERRAKAAADRGLAATVAATDLLLLEREVASFLDGGKADDIRGALRDASLPARGNRLAAELIAEDWR
jgi:hypothetical protein